MAKKQTDTKPTVFRVTRRHAVKCTVNVSGEDRSYNVSLLPGNDYTVVDNLSLEIDPYSRKVRKDKFEEIKNDLPMKEN